MTDTDTGSDWRDLDGVATAWLTTSSLTEGAALAGRVTEVADHALVDVRPTGVRVRLDGGRGADAVSAIAHDLGRPADPTVLQQLGVVVDSSDPAGVRAFWQHVLAYDTGDDGGLYDPLRRDPTLDIVASHEARPLRNRIHLDVVRPADVVEAAALGEAFGPYDVCHADPDGNEVDVVPGDALGESDSVADWRLVFGAMACYRTTSPAQQRGLIAAVAALADEARFPLMIDVRPGLVIVDSGKDQADADAHGLDLDFADLAAQIQTAASEVGATADPELSRFVQVVLDAVDVDAVQAFWLAVLDYVRDGREGVTDIVDPRRLNPVLVFQDLDEADVERRRQRNRIHLELTLPSDVAEARRDAAVVAGGHLLDESDGAWRLADPAGNEMTITVGG